MALFGMGKKKDEIGEMPPIASPVAQAPETNPTPSPLSETISRLKQQNLSNNQIIQYLQREGHKSNEIFNAMNQIEMKGGAAAPLPGAVPPEQAAPVQPVTQPGPVAPRQGAPPPLEEVEGPQAAEPTAPSMGFDEDMGTDKEKVEEIAETIIEEKWEALMKNINKIVEWKEKTEERIIKIEENSNNLKESFDDLHKGILGKISEYDQSLTNVGTEIKALEKVFQKILPNLTENVNELSRITLNMKKKTGVTRKK